MSDSTDLSGGYAGGGWEEMWEKNSTEILIGVVVVLVLLLVWYYWVSIKKAFGYPEKMYIGAGGPLIYEQRFGHGDYDVGVSANNKFYAINVADSTRTFDDSCNGITQLAQNDAYSWVAQNIGYEAGGAEGMSDDDATRVMNGLAPERMSGVKIVNGNPAGAGGRSRP